MAKLTSTSPSSLSRSAYPSPSASPPYHTISDSNPPKLPTLSTSPSLYPGCCLTLSSILPDFLRREIIRGGEDGDSEGRDKGNRHSQNRATNSTRERCILSIGCGTGLLECYLQREFDGYVDVGDERSRDADDGGGDDDDEDDGNGEDRENGEEFDDGGEYGDGEDYGNGNNQGERGKRGKRGKKGKRVKYTVEGVEVYTSISSSTTCSTTTSTVNTYLGPENMQIVKGTWEICPRAFDADVAVWLFVYPRQTGLVRGYIEMLGMLDAGDLRGKRVLPMDEERREGGVDASEVVDGGEGREEGEEEVEQTDVSRGDYMGGRYGEGGHGKGMHESSTHKVGRCEIDTRETDTHGTGAGVRLIIWAGPKQDWTDYEDVFQSMRGWKLEMDQSEEAGVMDFECLAMIRRQPHQSLPSS